MEPEFQCLDLFHQCRKDFAVSEIFFCVFIWIVRLRWEKLRWIQLCAQKHMLSTGRAKWQQLWHNRLQRARVIDAEEAFHNVWFRNWFWHANVLNRVRLLWHQCITKPKSQIYAPCACLTHSLNLCAFLTVSRLRTCDLSRRYSPVYKVCQQVENLKFEGSDLSIHFQNQVNGRVFTTKGKVHDAIHTQLLNIVQSSIANMLPELQVEVWWEAWMAPFVLKPSFNPCFPTNFLACVVWTLHPLSITTNTFSPPSPEVPSFNT